MAGTLSISMTGSAVQNGSRSLTVQDADWQTLIDYYKAKITTTQNPTPTNAQALTQWLEDIRSGIASIIKKQRVDAAVATAQAGVADPNIT